jgi:hypothetical protein
MEYDLFISNVVLLELGMGEWEGKRGALQLIQDLNKVEVTEEVESVAGKYVSEKLVPGEEGADSVHLALACVHGMDFLLTWNIRHLANPNKREHLNVINRRLGVKTPEIVTPEGLWPVR